MYAITSCILLWKGGDCTSTPQSRRRRKCEDRQWREPLALSVIQRIHIQRGWWSCCAVINAAWRERECKTEGSSYAITSCILLWEGRDRTSAPRSRRRRKCGDRRRREPFAPSVVRRIHIPRGWWPCCAVVTGARRERECTSGGSPYAITPRIILLEARDCTSAPQSRGRPKCGDIQWREPLAPSVVQRIHIPRGWSPCCTTVTRARCRCGRT